MFDAMQGAVQGVHASVQTIGMQCFGWLFFIVLVWFGAQVALEQGDITDVFGRFLRTVMLGGLAYWFMTPYADGQTPLVWFVDKITTAVTAALLPSGDGSMGGILSSGFQSVYAAVGQVWGAMLEPLQGVHGVLGGLDALRAVLKFLPEELFLGLAAVLLWFAAIAMFVMATIGLFMFKIADILAPVFIPFLVVPVTSWLFDGWLRFLLSACMYKVAGAAILLLGNAVLAHVTGLLALGQLDWGPIMFLSILMSGMAFALLYIMLQLPAVAQGLVSGHATVQMQRMMGSVARGGRLASGTSLAVAGSGPQLAEGGASAFKEAVAAAKAARQYAGNVAADAGTAYRAGGIRNVMSVAGQGAGEQFARLGRGALSNARRASEAMRQSGINLIASSRKR